MKKMFYVAFFCILGLLILLYNFREQLGEYLVVDETPRRSDVIIVLTGDRYRVDKAIVLYQRGYARKILFSGCEPEQAKFMTEKAASAGIPRENIAWESSSKNTYQNAKYSYDYMKNNDLKTAIVVTSDYHTRRAFLCFESVFPQAQDFVISARRDNFEYNARNWWRNDKWRQVFFLEYAKLLFYKTGCAKYL